MRASGSCQGCTAKLAGVQLYSAFSWGPQTLILQWTRKTYVQLYLRQPHSATQTLLFPQAQANAAGLVCRDCHFMLCRLHHGHHAGQLAPIFPPLWRHQYLCSAVSVGQLPSCSPPGCGCGCWAPASICSYDISNSTRSKLIPASERNISLRNVNWQTLQFASMKGKVWPLWYYVLTYASSSWEKASLCEKKSHVALEVRARVILIDGCANSWPWMQACPLL